jgi:potassium/hydrogen antiporter
LVNVIVRGDQAIPPRGSTRLHAGDHVHILIRQEETKEIPRLMKLWAHGPIGRPRLKRARTSRTPIFTVAPGKSGWVTGDMTHPDFVRGLEVVDQLRARRDEPGSLVLLSDGRYALTGELIVIGSRDAVSDWANRRLRRAPEGDETAWLEDIIGALAAEASLRG